MKGNTETVCRSVFRNRGNEPDRELFMRAWVKLINGREGGKNGMSVGSTYGERIE